MINREEIESKASDFKIHTANVERDYVFGWLLASIYGNSPLGPQLVLKGGNCLRKGYFPTTRFSDDLDFSTQGAIEPATLVSQLNDVCGQIQVSTGVQFDTDRTRVEEKSNADRDRRLYQARVYFKDFYGNPETITISVRVDVTAFDRLYLPIQNRPLIHPYSDSGACSVDIRCVKLEELLAIKLKCLLQRRHIADLFDLVYGIFINRDIEVDRAEVLQNFLYRTIFRPSPGTAKNLLLELPLEAFRSFWRQYIVCPATTLFEFDLALQGFRQAVESVFGDALPGRYGELAFFPSNLRNPIMEAATNQVILEFDYHGRRRRVEPYSLAYKQRRDGFAREYFYGYDQTGGRTTGPGIKTFLHTDISNLLTSEEHFEPRFPIELSKAGELGTRTYFGSTFGGVRRQGPRRVSRRARWIYTVECRHCGRHFRRLKSNSRLRAHKNDYGSDCYGRSGSIVDRRYV